MFAVILMLGLAVLAEADINEIELHVTPVRHVTQGDMVRLKCEINVTLADSEVLPDDVRMTWYDGFIPIPAVNNVYELNGYHLRQIIVNITVTDWLQYGRYVCKLEDNNGTISMKNTAVLPEGMQGEYIFRNITPERPGVVMVSCAFTSTNVHWSKLSIDLHNQSSYHHGFSFFYDLSSYDQSAKFVCHTERLHSIIYVHPKDYEPVRFIYPGEDETLVFTNVESKTVECSTTGSLKPNMTWTHKIFNTPLHDVVKRIHVVEAFSTAPPYAVQLNIVSPVPYLDGGEYICIVENEWETVNRSVIVKFELLRGKPFHIATFAPMQYMFEGNNFTSRCFIQVADKNRISVGQITVLFYVRDCNNRNSQLVPLVNVPRVKYGFSDQFDENGDRWIVAEMTIANTTFDDSGCYYCIAANFDHTDNSSSTFLTLQTPFNITSYEPEITLAEKGSNKTLSCVVTVDENYDIKLVSVYYRYYATPEVANFIKYNANISIDTVNNTITANLDIASVDIQHYGFYECYARSVPADLYIDLDDYFYETGRNTTLNVTRPIEENKSTDAHVSSGHVTVIIVSVLSLMSAITLVLIILLSIYIIRKRLILKYRRESRALPLIGDESLLPISPDIPSESKSRQPSLLMREIVTSGWYFPHSDLKFEGTLGSGEFGIVMSALANNIEADKPVSKVAVKILPGLGDKEIEEDLRKELAALSLVGTYKHIVSMMGASYTEGKLEIIVEFCAKGSLLHHLRAKRNAKEKDFQPLDVVDYAHQIALGMQYLVEKKCIHCDLAARNILITEDNVLKVSDFGLARKLYDEIYKKSRTSRTRLPVRWMAIESIRDLNFTSESDVWAFGIVLWEIVQLGSTPYPGIENRKILGLLKRGYRMPQPPECPDDIYKVMRNCWKTQPVDRPSFRKLVARLQDLKDQYKSTPHGYINWHAELSSTMDPHETLGCNDTSDNEDIEEEKMKEVKEFVCPVHGRLSLTGDDAKLLVKEQHSVDSGISNSTENIHKKAEVSYVNATNQLFKIHDRLRLQSADSGVGDNGTNNPYTPTAIIPTCSAATTKKQASRVDSGMPDSPCYSKSSPPYTNVTDTFSHFPPLSPTGSNAYCTDPTSTGTVLNRRLSAHPDNRPMFPALGIEESDV